MVPIGKIKTRVEFNEASKCYIHVCHNSSNGRSCCDDGDIAQSPVPYSLLIYYTQYHCYTGVYSKFIYIKLTGMKHDCMKHTSTRPWCVLVKT